MLKLQVSASWMMSRRAAETRRERARVGREGRRESLESGGARGVVDARASFEDEGERMAVGRRKVVRAAGTDFVR
jgi:hypothetical protein